MLLVGLSACAAARNAVDSPHFQTAVSPQTVLSPNLSSANLVHYPVPGAYIDSLAAGPNGTVWFVDALNAKIGKVTQTGTITEYPIPNGDGGDADALVQGGSNFMYYNGFAGIYKVTTDGNITLQFPGPPNTDYTGVTVAPDGTIWSTAFQYQSEDKVVRFSPGHGYTVFTTPTPNSCPKVPVAGPDGNIWFIELCTGYVGKSTLSGAITEYPGFYNPSRIANGNDGYLYVCDSAYALVRVATDGTFKNLPMGSPCSSDVPGLHHLMWMTLNHTDAGIRTLNVLTDKSSNPLRDKGAGHIVIDTDKNIWFTDSQGIAEYKSGV